METAIQIPRPKLRRSHFVSEILKTVFMVIAVYALVELAAPRFYVEGRSMQPNFQDGQRLIVSRVNYLFGDPERGDIVVLKAPGQPDTNPPLIKRVVGLPNETVTIQDTHIYINDVELNEPYINEPCDQFHCENNTWTLGPDEYFVMGDNRNHSNDSRRFGVVRHDLLIGEVLVRYWPPSDWGIVSQVGFPN